MRPLSSAMVASVLRMRRPMKATRDETISPTTVAVSPTINSAMGLTLRKSTWRLGKCHRRSCTVVMLSVASLACVVPRMRPSTPTGSSRRGGAPRGRGGAARLSGGASAGVGGLAERAGAAGERCAGFLLGSVSAGAPVLAGASSVVARSAQAARASGLSDAYPACGSAATTA